MKITFYIPQTQDWNRAQAFTLAREQAIAGYTVRVIESRYHSTVSEDGVTCMHPRLFARSAWVRALWVFWYFMTSRRGIVHVAGVRGGFVVALLRVLHPASRIILHVDDVANVHTGFITHLAVALAIRLAHVRMTSRKDLLRHEAFLQHTAQFMPYAMHTGSQIIDSSILRAFGLELQQYFLAYVQPSQWADVQSLVKDWREYVRKIAPHAKLAILFTEDTESQHMAFGHDVAILGVVNSYSEQMLKAGARAVLVPSLSRYRLPIFSAMATGKYAIPLRDLVNRNPFALEELADIYRSEDHAIEDLQDAALTMSWGHIARTIIATEHNPTDVALKYEDLYEHLLFADSITARARLS